jgi:hypothetical protein
MLSQSNKQYTGKLIGLMHNMTKILIVPKCLSILSYYALSQLISPCIAYCFAITCVTTSFSLKHYIPYRNEDMLFLRSEVHLFLMRPAPYKGIKGAVQGNVPHNNGIRELSMQELAECMFSLLVFEHYIPYRNEDMLFLRSEVHLFLMRPAPYKD